MTLSDPFVWLAAVAWITFFVLCARVVNRNSKLAKYIDEVHPTAWAHLAPVGGVRRRGRYLAQIVVGGTASKHLKDEQSKALLKDTRVSAACCAVAFGAAVCCLALIGRGI